MRLGITLSAALVVAAVSGAGIAPVLAAGQAVVEVSVGQDEPAREWDIDVTGGTSSTDHLTLAPMPLGFRAEFTVAVAGASASVAMTAALPVERGLASVGCLDDAAPPTEIQPVVVGPTFTLDVVPGRRYSCFAISAPLDEIMPVAPIAPGSQAPADKPLPPSDTSANVAAAPPPGWPVVVFAVFVILGIALVLRPARR